MELLFLIILYKIAKWMYPEGDTPQRNNCSRDDVFIPFEDSQSQIRNSHTHDDFKEF